MMKRTVAVVTESGREDDDEEAWLHATHYKFLQDRTHPHIHEDAGRIRGGARCPVGCRRGRACGKSRLLPADRPGSATHQRLVGMGKLAPRYSRLPGRVEAEFQRHALAERLVPSAPGTRHVGIDGATGRSNAAA